MYIDFISDLHFEINDNVRIEKEPGGDVLILAGDIINMRLLEDRYTDPYARGRRAKFDKFINDFCAEYDKIFYLPGNHEYYQWYLEGADYEFAGLLTNRYGERIEFVNNTSRYFTKDEEVAYFIFSTYWSDFDNGNPLTMHAAQSGMNDYRLIRKYETDAFDILTPDDTLGLNHSSKLFVKNAYEARLAKSEMKTIVATHHAPSYASLTDDALKGDALNGAFYNKDDDWIFDTNISYWIHGHTHADVDYNIGTCNVLGCMYGYDAYERKTSERPKMIKRIEV